MPQRDVTLLFFNSVCGDYVILLVTFFVANQIVPQNISRTSLRVVLLAQGYISLSPGNRASISVEHCTVTE